MMKKNAFTKYICCIRSMHMHPSLYAEMMERLGMQDTQIPERPQKTESAGWIRFQRIAAAAVCLILCVTVGWFAFTLHEDMRHMPVSPPETNTEPYEPVDISDIISRALEITEYTTYSDIDNAISWFSKYVKEQQDGLRSIMDGVGDPHNGHNYIIGPYIRTCCEQIGIVQCFQRFQPVGTEYLKVIHYQYTADRRLYTLIANLSDETQQLDCDNVWIYTGSSEYMTGYAGLHFTLPDYPHSWMQPYLSGTVRQGVRDDVHIAEIPPHSAIELCAVLPDTLEINPMRTPHIKFYNPFNSITPVISDSISLNWQEPDLPRTEENKLLKRLKDAYDENEIAKRISKQQYNIPSE